MAWRCGMVVRVQRDTTWRARRGAVRDAIVT
jgi:hypothetical protein